jgi:hypothetical protein
MSTVAGNVLRSRAASEPRLTAALPRADTYLVSAVPTTAARNAAKPFTVSRVLARRLALPALFVVAATYHALQSLGHATPTVFNDELLYGKLSQSIAAGHWFSIRGEHVFFPAILAPLVQSPAWLLGSTMDAYTAAKLINAALMSAAVFPAYWLAVRVVRQSFALLTAAAAVATPALFYHGYLMSEALAYPVFLGAVAVLGTQYSTLHAGRPSSYRWCVLSRLRRVCNSSSCLSLTSRPSRCVAGGSTVATSWPADRRRRSSFCCWECPGRSANTARQDISASLREAPRTGR